MSRQVLAEPTSDIVERTWASLADGTPLVTGAKRDKGTLVLFHVTPEATWSNLPISGSFVEMLRRIVQLSRNQGAVAANAGWSDCFAGALPHDRRRWRADPADTRRAATGAERRSASGDDREPARPLWHRGRRFRAQSSRCRRVIRTAGQAAIAAPLTELRYALDESRDLKGPLVAAALMLMLLDTLAVFWMGGLFSRRPRSTAHAAAISGVLVLLSLGMATFPDHARAQDARPGDAEAIDAISQTRIAYVLTGDAGIDATTAPDCRACPAS